MQNGNPIYGDIVSFDTGMTLASVRTDISPQKITYNSANIYWTLTQIGEPVCTETGICYSTSSNPTTSKKVVGYVSTTKQSVSLTGLNSGTVYYYRAYAIQDGKTIYGDIYSFTTGTPPTVITESCTGLSNQYGLMNMWQVTLKGNVTSVGNPAITKKGFVYSSNGDPETNGTNVSVSGSTAGSYSASLTGLKSNTTYYVRAYVQNSLGKVYGDIKSFTTGN